MMHGRTAQLQLGATLATVAQPFLLQVPPHNASVTNFHADKQKVKFYSSCAFLQKTQPLKGYPVLSFIE